jgi:hypothetical protein
VESKDKERVSECVLMLNAVAFVVVVVVVIVVLHLVAAKTDLSMRFGLILYWTDSKTGRLLVLAGCALSQKSRTIICALFLVNTIP